MRLRIATILCLLMAAALSFAQTNDYVLEGISSSDTTLVLRPPLPFDSSVVDNAVNQLLQPYQRRGHYFARARVDDVTAIGDSVTLHVQVVPGPVVAVRDLVFVGLERTKAERLGRSFTVGAGEPLTERTLARIRSEAGAIGFVSFTGPINVRVLPGYREADLELIFREKQQVSIFGGGGYVPDDDIGLVWNVRLGFTNLFGGGRRADIRSARPGDDRNELTVSYTQPLFWLGRDEGKVEVATRDYRDDFYEFSAMADYTATVRTGFDLSFGVGFKRVEPTGDLPGYSSYSATVGAMRSSLDDALNPASGLRLTTSLRYGYRRYSTDTTVVAGTGRAFNETLTRVQVEFYQSLAGPLVGHIGAVYRGLETSQELPPLSELLLIGGPGSLRGYRTDQFAVQRAAVLTLEPRLRFVGGYLFGFYELAYLNRPVQENSEVDTDEFYRSGFGAGLALRNDLRSVTLSLGWGEGAAVDEPHLSVELSSDI
ncbi:BamA/TamA family outer membrane protein [candidate division GN15 bacterium]|nr:BamA/TamA family outer membrane protein [candidate division GN15 bacterium]